MIAPIGSAVPGGTNWRGRSGSLSSGVELGDLDRPELEVTLRQRLDAIGAVELRPFGAQDRDGVALAADLGAQLRDPLRLHRRLELDLVDVGRRQHEGGDHQDVEDAQHLSGPRHARRARAARGNGSGASTARRAVRSAARSWAERARGLAAISSASGDDGLRREQAKAWRHRTRRAADGARPPRRGCGRPETLLTMRSSSEWNEIDHQAPAGRKHALGRGQRVGEFLQLLVHEHAQRLERARRRMDVARPRPHDPRQRYRRAPAWSGSAPPAAAPTIARATARA